MNSKVKAAGGTQIKVSGENGTPDNAPLSRERLGELAARGCRKCHGRGYEGIEKISGQPVVCGCVKRKLRAERDEAVRRDMAAAKAEETNTSSDSVAARVRTADEERRDRLVREIARLEEQARYYYAQAEALPVVQELAGAKAAMVAEVERVRLVEQQVAAERRVITNLGEEHDKLLFRLREIDKECATRREVIAKLQDEIASFEKHEVAEASKVLRSVQARHTKQVHPIRHKGHVADAKAEKLTVRLRAIGTVNGLIGSKELTADKEPDMFADSDRLIEHNDDGH
jgi:hypothetical protein